MLFLFAVIAMAFPVLYSAQADEADVSLVTYQVSALTERTIEDEVVIQKLPSVREPQWNLEVPQEVVVAEPEVEEEEEEEVQSTKPVQTVKPAPTPIVEPAPVQKVVIAEPVVVTEVIEKKEELMDERSAQFANMILLEIQRLTNRARKHEDLHTLKNSTSLTSIALEHSADMLSQDYFAHTTPGGCTLTCRFEVYGYDASTWGENIASMEGVPMPSAKEVAQSFFEQWMESNGHRENILSNEYTHQGIGVLVQGDEVYVTVNFAKPL